MSSNIAGIDKQMLENLKSKFWRLNHLYWIRDKDGKEVPLKLNKAQITVFRDYKHNKKIILKQFFLNKRA